MGMKKRTILSLFGTVAALCAFAAGPNQKFMKEAAKAVWDQPLEQFNPATELTDSIFEDASAAYIAVYEDVSAKMEDSPFSQPSRSKYIYENTLVHYVRKMVRINDASAIDNFSDFTFAPRLRIEAIAGYPQYEREEAFGARIYKPDGSVVDVDMGNTLVETSGKKGKKAEKYKIAIPGLEVGDVLDYFRYTKFRFLGNQSVGMTIDVMEKYPIHNYTFNSTFDPGLSIELTSHNGLEIPAGYVYDAKGNFKYDVTFSDIMAFDSPKWFSAGRQMPFMTLYVSDNKSLLFDRSASARVAGFYVNLVAPVIMREISEYYAEDIVMPYGVVGKVNSMVNDYRKAHPDATDRQIADAAWLATVYFVSTDSENKYSEWKIISLFKDVLDKQKLETPVLLAVTSPRSGVDVESLGGRHRAVPMVMVGDVPYMFDKNLSMAPGELQGEYINEKMFTFGGKREEIFKLNDVKITRLPKSSARQNADVRDVTVTIPADPSSTDVTFSYTSTMTGAMKDVMGDIVNEPDYLKGVEDFLDIPAKKRNKRKYDIVALNAANREILEDMPKTDFDIENCHVDSASMISLGFLPDATQMKYAIAGTIDGLFSMAGDDMIFNIGRLGGNFADFKDLKEERDIDIITAYPSQVRTNLTVNIPEGYYVEESELADLNSNLNNVCGQFYTQASLTPEGNVMLQVQLRNPSTIYSYSQWGDFLAVRRAAAEFSAKNIVIHKK